MKYRLTRSRVDNLNLPDEVIEHICSFISPVELCLSGWERVSKGFRLLLENIYASCKTLDTVYGNDQKFFEQFTNPNVDNDLKMIRKFELVVSKIFPHVNTLTIAAFPFCKALHWIEANEAVLLMRNLRTLHIVLGDGCGHLVSDGAHNDFVNARRFAQELKSVKLTVILSRESQKLVTSCSFRMLVRFLMLTAGAAGTWSLCLKDKTQRAQGWFCPAELAYYRSVAFISYVRTVIELGINLQELQLLDELKMSPYMIVMKERRRFLYMYDEFKQCENLVICYDIGIVAPSFPHEIKSYSDLHTVELVASHVLYKEDFLRYLSEAHNITVLRILLPYHWTERVQRCTYGCFRNNADYGCFMEYGWAAVPYYLPKASVVFI